MPTYDLVIVQISDLGVVLAPLLQHHQQRTLSAVAHKVHGALFVIQQERLRGIAIQEATCLQGESVPLWQ